MVDHLTIKKQKPLKVKLTYKQVPTNEIDQQKIDHAFDILFDEVIQHRGKQARKGDPF